MKGKVAALERLIHTGSCMSNVAFNLGQNSNTTLQDHTRGALRALCSGWDNALREYRALAKQSATRKPRARKR